MIDYAQRGCQNKMSSLVRTKHFLLTGHTALQRPRHLGRSPTRVGCFADTTQTKGNHTTSMRMIVVDIPVAANGVHHKIVRVSHGPVRVLS